MPKLSPNKTVEGFIGGGLSATLFGGALWWATPFSPFAAAGLAAVIVVMGFFGGLVMSAIKRDRGVKDYGDLIPGHGGVMDRVDSLCFAAPVFFTSSVGPTPDHPNGTARRTRPESGRVNQKRRPKVARSDHAERAVRCVAQFDIAADGRHVVGVSEHIKSAAIGEFRSFFDIALNVGPIGRIVFLLLFSSA